MIQDIAPGPPTRFAIPKVIDPDDFEALYRPQQIANAVEVIKALGPLSANEVGEFTAVLEDAAAYEG